jgi:hypothetical protein
MQSSQAMAPLHMGMDMHLHRRRMWVWVLEMDKIWSQSVCLLLLFLQVLLRRERTFR